MGRIRYQVSLYTEYESEAEIADYLTSFDVRKRQEIIRTLVKAGYSSMVKHKNSSASMLSSVDPDMLNALMQQLMVNGAGIDTGYKKTKEEAGNKNNKQPETINNSAIKKEKKKNPKAEKTPKSSETVEIENPVVEKVSKKPVDEKNDFETNSDLNNDDEFLDEDPSIYIDDDIDIDDDDDIIDPLAALMSKMN